MIKECIDVAGVGANVFSSVSEYVKTKYPKQIINIYGSYEALVEENDIDIIKFVCDTYRKHINTDLTKYYIEGRITLWQLCKLYCKNFWKIMKTRKDLKVLNRLLLAWHKANFKTHRTVNFCNVESYIDNKEKYDNAFKLKFKIGAINTLRLVRFIDIIPENYYKSKTVLKHLEKYRK